jgi:DNA-binding IclR family transcriptional regulator
LSEPLVTRPCRYRIRVLEKARAILDLLGEDGDEMTVTRIAQRLGMSKATAFRIVNVLEDANYLERSTESQGYRLGFNIYRLGVRVDGNSSLQKAARPLLEELKERCGETVHLVVMHRGEALYLDKIQGGRALGVISRVGMRLPAHCSGVGKVLLAHLPAEEVDAVVSERGLPRFTPATITDREGLKEELERIRRRGYAVDNEEIEPGLKCIAAPVRGAGGRVVAAVSISGPKFRFDDAETERLVRDLLRSSERISRAIAHLGQHRNEARRSRNATTGSTGGRQRVPGRS